MGGEIESFFGDEDEVDLEDGEAEAIPEIDEEEGANGGLFEGGEQVFEIEFCCGAGFGLFAFFVGE